MENLIGQVLDNRYSIREQIGEGGMSVVYKAEDAFADRNVAVKVLKEDLLKDQPARRRFLNESRAIAMLSHENIVDVLDVNFEGDIQYIVMEYIEGITLKEYIRIKGALPIDEALGFCTQILSALQHAHERGVIHRDIKPQNIMLLSDGKIKVTDFGIAHVSDTETITMTDMAIGSVHYISPEQAKGLPSDEKSDVYSTGVMLYEMVTGTLPFEAVNAVSVALMQVEKEPRKPSEIIPTLPVGVEQIILKSMQKNVRYRYQSASEMLSDIETYNENNAVVFNHEKPRPDIFEEDVEDDMSAKKKTKIKILRTRRSLVTAALGVALAAVVVLVGYIIMSGFIGADGDKIPVPQLVGRSITDVLADTTVTDNFVISQESRYSADEEAGIILQQGLVAGRTYGKGTELTVVVSLGDEVTIVPQLIGKTGMAAQSALREANLTFVIEYEESYTGESNIVLNCAPSEGMQVAVGTVVTLTIRKIIDPDTVTLTDMTGSSKSVAIALLTANGLSYNIIEQNSTQAAGIVIDQNPGAGQITKGSTVTLYVSNGVPPTATDDTGDSGQQDPDVTPDDGTGDVVD